MTGTDATKPDWVRAQDKLPPMGGVPTEPQLRHHMTAEQQIRAKALEITIALLASAPEDVKAAATPSTTTDIAEDFYRYIKDGK